MAQDSSTFHSLRILIPPCYPKEHSDFPFIRQYFSTTSLLNNPDNDSYTNNVSQSFHSNQRIPIELFNPNNSSKTILTSPQHSIIKTSMLLILLITV